LPDDLVVGVELNTQPKRVVTMKSRIARLAVVAIVLLMGRVPSDAEAAAPSSGSSPFAQTEGFNSEASFSGYIGDDSELRAPAGIADQPLPLGVQARPAAYGYDLSPKSGVSGGKDAKGGKGGLGKGDHASGPWIYGPWVSVEYLSTWLQGRYLPPLVSTSPPGTAGVVPGASILFGGDDLSDNRQTAGKLTIGGWLDPSEQLGLVGNFFLIETESVGFHGASDASGSPLLARPIYETWPSADGGVGPASFLVSGPTTVGNLPFILDGQIDAVAKTDVLGAEGYLRYLLFCAPGQRLDLIGGYQFSRVDDRLTISSSTDIDPQFFGANFAAEDIFDTQNKFHGGTIGLLGQVGSGPVVLSVLAKVGLGDMNQRVTIDGQSALTDAGGFTSHYTSGILALPTNMGTYEQDKFAVIPEAEIKLTFKLTKHLEATVGYDFIYWSSLALAGEQIDTSLGNLPTVNSSQWFGGSLDPAGGSYPGFNGIKDSSLYLQGLSVGLTLRM